MKRVLAFSVTWSLLVVCSGHAQPWSERSADVSAGYGISSLYGGADEKAHSPGPSSSQSRQEWNNGEMRSGKTSPHPLFLAEAAGAQTVSKPHAVLRLTDTATGPLVESDEVARLREQIIDLQNKGKLGFRKIVPCSSVERFGVYSPLEPGQDVSNMVLYFEPANVSTLVSGDRFVIDCSVDLFILDKDGRAVAGKKEMLRINRVSRSPILDLHYNVQMQLKKPLQGDLIIKTVLHDRIKNQSASASMKINTAPGAKKLIDPI